VAGINPRFASTARYCPQSAEKFAQKSQDSQRDRSPSDWQSSPMNSSMRPLAIISGGSRGLGFATARGLAADGFDLALIAKDPQRLESARQSLLNEFAATQTGLTITTHAVDLEDQVATRNMATQISETLTTPKALVLAHGVMSEKMSKTLRTTDAEWNRVVNINLNSVFILVNAIAPAMAEAREGRVVIYSACLGRMSGPGNAGGLAPYRISKAGVNALVRNLAHETGMGARGFYVDAICPNHTRTDMGGPDAPRSVEAGAETAIWLATSDISERGTDQITGLLWEDRKIVPF
jgi:3-oxoacyl-[acyl-carrier protein] reductase